MFNSPVIIYALVFGAVLLIADALLRYLFAKRRSSDEVRNRLETLKLKHGTEEAVSNLLLRRGVSRRMEGEALGNTLRRYYAQSGLELSLPRRILYVLMIFVVIYAIGAILFGLAPLLALALALAVTPALCVFLVYRLRARRIKVFTSQLAPGIDVIVRSLHAGHPLNAAIALLAREMPDPIGSEFGILRDQMTFGSDLDQAMLNMIDRVGAPELNLLSITVSVQRGTGGNLSEILENLAQMIRDRLMLRAKIRAISAEGRFTAWVMMLFPFFLFTMIRTMVPTYFEEVWASGYGAFIVTGCLVFMAIGMLVIRKLVNFDF